MDNKGTPKQRAIVWLEMVLGVDGTETRSRRAMTEEALREIKLITELHEEIDNDLRPRNHS